MPLQTHVKQMALHDPETIKTRARRPDTEAASDQGQCNHGRTDCEYTCTMRFVLNLVRHTETRAHQDTRRTNALFGFGIGIQVVRYMQLLRFLWMR